MKFFRLLLLLGSLPASSVGGNVSFRFRKRSRNFAANWRARFRARKGKTPRPARKPTAGCSFAAEFRLLSLGRFWGDEAPKVSRSHKPELADPIPAIVDFQKQLKARGIDLLVVPVPPKAAIYPEKILPGFDVGADDPAPVLHRFYEELRAAGIDVLDLAPLFVQNRDDKRGGVFCKTDSHWSGLGCMLAAQAIAEKIRGKLTAPASRKDYVSEWKEVRDQGRSRQPSSSGCAKARSGKNFCPERE